jgi:hypothetical protein
MLSSAKAQASAVRADAKTARASQSPTMYAISGAARWLLRGVM